MAKLSLALLSLAAAAVFLPLSECGQPTPEELGIRADRVAPVTASSCRLCLSTFFKVQASKYPLPALLRHRCPVLKRKREPAVCNRLVHHFLMNGPGPGANACAAVGECDTRSLRKLRKTGVLARLDALAGYGKARSGKFGVWGGFRVPDSAGGEGGAAAEAVTCLRRCKRVALLARMRFNLRGLHGLSALEDKACPQVKDEEGREVCRLAINYVRLNGAAETPDRICHNISACSFHIKDKIVDQSNAANDGN